MREIDVVPTLRLNIAAGVAIGPGKAALLDGIANTGSISRAAKEMGMGYRQAWAMIDSMNDQFVAPLVERTKGGPEGGGTKLTPLGIEVLQRYKTMEQKAIKAIEKDARDFEKLLKT
ncbi:winged helix-turn-helix domain-containing protein [Burkholderia multivorans]|nr:winged helix-turn-helix domain-containing protein [Burkholderia multivorans]